MAIYHLSAKIISRKAGRSATAAAAYRAAVEIEDQRTGEVHDYTRKRGVESAELLLPDDAPAWAADRSALWNAVEAKNKRADAQVAREIVVALPDELSPLERGLLARRFGQEIAQTYRVGVDLAIHRPGAGGDDRNHHAHLLLTTNRLGPDGLGNKAREFDGIAAARSPERGTGNAVERLRERWAELTNAALERAGRPERIDHRSLKAQGIEDREPTRHLGPGATAIERQSGEPSRRREAHQAETAARIAAVRESQELERQGAAVAAAIQRAELEGRDWERIAEGLREFEANKAAREQAAAEALERETRDSAERAAAAKAREAEREAMREAHRRQVAEILGRSPDGPPAVAKAAAGELRQEPGAEQVYTERLHAIERRRQVQAAADLEALRVERERLGQAHRAHQAAKPGIVRLPGSLSAWKREGDALSESERTLLERESAAQQTARPEAIQAAARAELRKAAPDLVEGADAERKAREARELERRQREQAKQTAARERANAGRDFKLMAMSREMRSYGYTDHSERWQAMPAELRDKIEAYNRLPTDRRPAELERIGKDPRTAELMKAAREIVQSQERSR